VLLFGLPVRNTTSMLVQTRAEGVHDKCGISKEEFMIFDAMRAASQCIGRVIRSKEDWGIVVLADRRYARKEVVSKLPGWIRQFLNTSRVTSDLTAALEQAKTFLLVMAQPFKHNPQKLIGDWRIGAEARTTPLVDGEIDLEMMRELDAERE
jgi:DNA excision repair protein ERCC-2